MQLDVALYKSENGPACWLLKQIGVSNGSFLSGENAFFQTDVF